MMTVTIQWDNTGETQVALEDDDATEVFDGIFTADGSGVRFYDSRSKTWVFLNTKHVLCATLTEGEPEIEVDEDE